MADIDQAEGGSSETENPMAPIEKASDEAEKIRLTAELILEQFDDYYNETRQIPRRAQLAFENRDPAASLELSRRRLSVYSQHVNRLGRRLASAYPRLAQDEAPWRQAEERYLGRIEGRYEADLAYAFSHSVRRCALRGAWQPVTYSFGEGGDAAANPTAKVYRTFAGGAQVLPETVAEILAIPDFAVPYRDAAGDAALVAQRVNQVLGLDGRLPDVIESLQMIDAGFYRNRGA